jgi:hypothetical protein
MNRFRIDRDAPLCHTATRRPEPRIALIAAGWFARNIAPIASVAIVHTACAAR